MKSPTKLAAVVCVLLLAAGLCAAEDAAVESQDAVVETRDATIEPQDAVVETEDVADESEDVSDESEDVVNEPDVLDETEDVADKSPLTPTDDTAPTVQETSTDDVQLGEDNEVLQDAGKDALISEAGASAEASPTQDSEDAVDPLPPVTTPPPPSDAEAGEVPDVDSTPATAAPPPEPAWNRSAPDWFRRGVDAYLSEHWEECTRSLENAIVEWHFFRRANIDCRVRCGEEARRAAPLYAADVEHLHFVEEMVRATLCILKCKRRAFRGHATPDALPSAVQKTFRDLKAYEYLQLCYYQTQQTQKAASAVFTILSHDPNNEIMKHNLKYYLAKPGIDVNSIVNYESEKFVSLYTLGTEAYFKEEYDAAISNLEASLKEFFKASDECRADCEGPFDQGWLPDFTSSIANHFVYCLKCKAKCQSKLSVLNGEKYDDFLATHFNYLQFAYYKKGNLREACAAAGTYLLFLPGDSTMLENVEYYKTLPKVDDSMFRPRADAEKYIKRQSYEESLLTYISDEFVFEENEDTNEIPHAEEIYKDRGGDVIIKNGTPQSLLWATAHKTLTKIHLEPVNLNQDIAHKSSMLEEKRLMLGKNQKVEGESAENKIEKKSELNSSFEQLMNQLRRMTDRPIYNLRKEDELGGMRRFVIDGLAEENECERLIQFAKASGVSGDGYGGNKSPHSSQENFEGVTLGRAALMMNFGLIERSVLHLFLSLSERGRNMIAAYFNIPNKNLYFSYTHLVCRSAKPGEFFNSSQYSHEIHADNCWLSKNGDCMKADPAYYWRDYSALIYLNNNFKGGEFLFSADAYGNHIQSTIQPKCGRLVGFSSGIENLHGVRGVEQGSRCALALWFTLDSQRAEWGRALTEEVVHDIENGKEPKPEILHNLQKLVRFDLAQAQSQLLYKSSEQDGSMSDTHQDKYTVR